jgi:DNA repair photolyase
MEPLLFDDALITRPALPIIGEQSDIRYYSTHAKSVLNTPEATGVDFWSINPYVGCAFGCAYCYARYAHGYVLERAATANPAHREIATDLESLEPWLAFERRIFVKQNAPDVLRKALRFGSARHAGLARGEWIAIGTATDPYQPAERRFGVTRRILEVLADHPGLRIGIVTKSPLVTRDVDVLARIARHSSIRVHVSLISVDTELARRIEPRAPTPQARLRAIRRLREGGIDVGVNVMPVLPGITDSPAQLDALVRAIRDVGAPRVGACALRLRASARKRYLPFLEHEFPHLADRYRATYARDHRPGDRYRDGLSRVMRRLCRRYGVPYGSYDETRDDGVEADARSDDQLELRLDSSAT